MIFIHFIVILLYSVYFLKILSMLTSKFTSGCFTIFFPYERVCILTEILVSFLVLGFIFVLEFYW